MAVELCHFILPVYRVLQYGLVHTDQVCTPPPPQKKRRGGGCLERVRSSDVIDMRFYRFD